LATTGILGEPSFLQFLEYLQYWKQAEYARLIQYPHCLFFLDQLINNPVFRRELANVSFRNFIHEQQFYSWQYRAQNLYGQGLPAEAAETPSEKERDEQQEAQTQA
jgi:mediator of RNA polymerase II transcription subunit 31